jgi:dolichol-phosphate mannosyltransferase
LATAVVRGWKEAQGKVLAVMDGDLQHPPETLLSLIEALQEDGADIVIASRNVVGGGVSDWNIIRRGISWVGSLAATWILPGTLATVKDPMSGFFALQRSVIEGCDLNPTGYKILLEVLARGDYRVVKEIPYIFEERKTGGSKLGFRQCIEFLKHLVRLAWATGQLKQLMKYCIVGSSGVFVNMGILFLLTLSGIEYFTAGIVAVEGAILTNFIFNEFWSFAGLSIQKNSLKARLKRLLSFNLFCVVGANINLAILFLLTEYFHFHYLVSNAIGIIASTVWNYGMNANLTWDSARAILRVKSQARRENRELLTHPEHESNATVSDADAPNNSWRNKRLKLVCATLWLQILTLLFVIIEIKRGVQTPLADWGSRILRLFQ